MKPETSQTEFTKERYEATSRIYNCIDWPLEKLWYKKWRKKLWGQVQGPDVLEIGVGTGKNIPWYPANINVHGIDLTPGMLQHAEDLLKRKPDKNVILQEIDAQKLDFSNNRFDEVVATFVFCSIPDPVRALREALRVTRPGGKLNLLEHMRSNNAFWGALMNKWDTKIHYATGVHINRKTVENVEKSGWLIEEVEDLALGGVFKIVRARKST